MHFSQNNKNLVFIESYSLNMNPKKSSPKYHFQEMPLKKSKADIEVQFYREVFYNLKLKNISVKTVLENIILQWYAEDLCLKFQFNYLKTQMLFFILREM